jgi:glycosyltransferase involved in cell wall biosynthesis
VDNTEMRLMAALRYRPFRRIVAISDAVAAMLAEHGVDPARITVIRDAVDTQALAVAPDRDRLHREFDLPADALVMAAAGQLIPRKGHRYLLQALADLRPDYPELRLILFGEGHLHNQLRAQAAALGLEAEVRFAGFRDDLDSLLSSVDILVHPALAEGLGVVTLKAAAAGVPVVGFRAGGLVEAIAEGETGLLVELGNVAALRDAIARLAGDRALRQQFGAAGRKRMQTEFSIATMTDKHVSLYESVVHG